ncbi:pyridoxal 5'-phosphate synthase glutaminase subunit PdxT [Sinanaerobacter chloroacetimidivorans]|uniref:Pyridoxal 5'-phosphate synthase subunit PdxT n=1 Tax=Sinanaerobacter chloroacetimidivorans TaxID=2818044 RepID=A0A8J7VXT8_9FIRM|nr:pyridoxal 5'-phosphate synthase glutaminase subunit PdxT [Sinanaerobacter chloroacetimidivorans]MBR0596676.1 pyridoxal 5'-phosphate synthase glutaminase subunit PdxT [Sinanaerobacter chloroacetimidivorans]
MNKKIGVLAIQGAFQEHKDILRELNVDCFEIRQKSDLTNKVLDGIILPGGESTVIGKLLNELDMRTQLQQMIIDGLPVFGTCAGLILLAKGIVNDDNVYLSTMDIKARRNAYGRQLGSFSTLGDFNGIGLIPMTFIRAPYIESTSSSVEILATLSDHIVAARQKNMLVTSFHPELTSNLSVHSFFVNQLCI